MFWERYGALIDLMLQPNDPDAVTDAKRQTYNLKQKEPRAKAVVDVQNSSSANLTDLGLPCPQLIGNWTVRDRIPKPQITALRLSVRLVLDLVFALW